MTFRGKKVYELIHLDKTRNTMVAKVIVLSQITETLLTKNIFQRNGTFLV